MESTLKNMVLVLLTITFVAALAVGVVYSVTKDPIAKAKKAKIIKALSKVLPEFDNDPSTQTTDVEIDGAQVKIYTAKQGGNVVGYAIETFSDKGFSTRITLMVGFKPDGEIVAIETLQHTETPGLGDKIESKKSNFAAQFSGKNPANVNLLVKKEGGEIDAITAATISSSAYVDAVERAYKVLQTIKKEADHE